MTWELVADGLGFTEGPVWLPDGRVAVTSISQGAVHVVHPDGRVESTATGGGPNGLAAGPDGTLYVAQNGGIWGAPGRVEPGVQAIRDGRVEWLASGGAGMEAPNDLAFGPDGRLWVTDTRGECDWSDPSTMPPGRVWAVDVSSGEAEPVVAEAPRFVNGIGFTPDGAELLLTATVDAELWSHPLLGNRRRPGPGRRWHRFGSGHPDGLAMTADGVWVALTSGDRVDLVGWDGRVVASHPLPEGSLPTNVCLGGGSVDELYVTAARAGAVLRLRRP